MFCDVACMATPMRVLLKYSHSTPHSRTVATITDSLSSAMTSLPIMHDPRGERRIDAQIVRAPDHADDRAQRKAEPDRHHHD